MICGFYLRFFQQCLQKENDVYVYVDESGSITKTNVSNNRYFVIAMVFTDNPIAIRRLFKKKISQMIKKDSKKKETIILNKEIKGSELSEKEKIKIYHHILAHGNDKVELGVIVLDNNYTEDKFIENHARTFNYMIQVFFDSCYRNHSKYMRGAGNIKILLDEQNVATGAKYDLEEYLNQQLTIRNPICDKFTANYTDSKNEKLVQLADFIANTFYRNIEKKDRDSAETVKIWINSLCGDDVFDFSEAHDIELNMN
ncbi:DUF3800 domain-containing protein [Butyrivibrio sp. XBB1001]|uniref:DUF3800 domain-containing protein n=1 Tax=Butyrivibrio sp. XBB1001 TaxID=1280682 RepID=UPI000426569B|nr:DUF3800 domain-containing protein [Butyrivibrio sp. XBB1001]